MPNSELESLLQKTNRLISDEYQYQNLLRLVLASPVPKPNEPEVDTVQEYIMALGCGVVVEGEGFSAKRPFGNSCWEGEIRDAVDAGIIKAAEALSIPVPTSRNVIIDAARLASDPSTFNEMELAVYALIEHTIGEPDNDRANRLSVIAISMLGALFPVIES